MKIRKRTVLSLVLSIILVVATTLIFVTSAKELTSDISPTQTTMSADKDTSKIPKVATNTVELSKDNTIGKHDIIVNEKKIYKKIGDQEFSFKDSATCNLQLQIVDRGFDHGQGIEIGYISNGNQSQLFSGQIKSAANLDFVVPKSGKYSFYVECVSSDPILVEIFSVS